MSDLQPVHYNLAVQEMLNFLIKWNIPYELLTIQDKEKGTVNACIVFRDVRWNDSNTLVREDNQVKS